MFKVSIIIPIYNTEKYLHRCLESISKQTLKEIEIICINDSSTDKSLNILKQFSNNDFRIKIINLKKNKGVAFVRNLGIKFSSGKFLGFIDSDDYVDLDFFEKMHKSAIQSDSQIVKAEEMRIDFTGKKSKSNLTSLVEKNGKFSFVSEWTTAIYERAMLIENKIFFPENCIIGEDIVFLNKCVLHAKKIEIVKNTHYYYERREESLDSLLLTKKRIYSTINAYKIMANDRNSALLHELDPDSYTKLFADNIVFIFFLHYRTNNPETQIYCINSIFEMYELCNTKDLLHISFKYKSLIKFIISKDARNLIIFMNKFKSKQELIFYLIRSNAKQNHEILF